MTFAWPTAEIAVMGAPGAIPILYGKEIKKAENPAAMKKQKLQEYQEALYNPYIAASRGLIDEVILPRDSRARIISAFEMLDTKRETRPPKKALSWQIRSAGPAETRSRTKPDCPRDRGQRSSAKGRLPVL